MQKKLGLLVIVVIGSLLFLAPQSRAEDASFYAGQEVAKAWESLNGGDLAGALRSFKQATVIDPQYAPAYYGKGHAYLVQDKIGLAVANFKKTIELADPPMVEAYVNLGFALTLLGREQEGLNMYNQALALDPMNKEAHLNLANFYCSELNGTKAWEHIRFAQKMKAEISPEQLAEMESLCPEAK
ncbi:MAG: tetratricopeptide repeat protein [Thermodesulfobacteriota bacterium]